MLIELNRFLTTEDVRVKYGIPDALADRVLPLLKVAYESPDGTRFHLESEVDEFFAEWSRRQQNPQAAPATQADRLAPRLTEAEQNILEAIGDTTLTGEKLAAKAGYPCNSNFKNTLSSLVKRGLLVNDRPGYRRP